MMQDIGVAHERTVLCCWPVTDRIWGDDKQDLLISMVTSLKDSLTSQNSY